MLSTSTPIDQRRPDALTRHVAYVKRTPEEFVVVISDGQAAALYSDALPLRALGVVVCMPRASTVEFDLARQQWVATDARTGAAIAAGASREAVLRAERLHFNRRLRAGETPLAARES